MPEQMPLGPLPEEQPGATEDQEASVTEPLLPAGASPAQEHPRKLVYEDFWPSCCNPKDGIELALFDRFE